MDALLYNGFGEPGATQRMLDCPTRRRSPPAMRTAPSPNACWPNWTPTKQTAFNGCALFMLVAFGEGRGRVFLRTLVHIDVIRKSFRGYDIVRWVSVKPGFVRQ